ncbi:MAG TPA: protein kinase [Pyrinomonadaceae bacterium]
MNNDQSLAINSSRWRQIERLYNSALQLEPSARESFLAQACSEDESLRLEVLSLLSSADYKDSFLEEPAVNLGLAIVGLRYEAMVGKSIGRYHLLQLLGRGGMGEVYLAHDPRLNRRVALKLLPASFRGNQERVRRFEQEARAASAISHPNVAHIYEIGEAQGQRYITMEYIPGKTLRQIMKQGALGLNTALDITLQVLAALAAAHEAGVIHRDIKPENIMLQDDGYVKALDFGLAKLIETGAAKLTDDARLLSSMHTEPELLMGTSHYMSPEQVRRQSIDARTDLWSLGVVLYEMLDGERPFQGQAISEIIVSILEQEPLAPKRLDVPPALQALLTKSLRKQASERYQTAGLMLSELRQIRQQLGDEHQGSASMAIAPATWSGPVTNGSLTIATPPAAPFAQSTAEDVRPPTLSSQSPATAENSRINALPLSALKGKLQFQFMLLLLMVAGLCFGLLYGGRWKAPGRNFDLRFQRLNLSGNISDIVLSPDGKYIASVISEEGKQAIYIMELATSSNLRIIPPSDKGYSGLSFSPDGNYVYYLENQSETGTLYRVSKFGSGQRRILGNVNTPVTFSPDGQQIAFVRYNILEDTPDLIISQPDGAAERTLARRTRKDKDVFPGDMSGVGPAWSPDGKWLACATVTQRPSPREMNIEMVNVTDGTSRRLNATPWYGISRLAWLADGSGLIVAASESPARPWQLAFVSYPGGEIRRITNDPNNYSRVSGTSDSSAFLSLNVEETSSIWLIPTEGEKQAALLNLSQKKGVTEIAWKLDGESIYTVKDGENLNLWRQEPDATPARQLTFESNKNYRPAISADERHIVFVSSRAGAANIWRMDMDGTQLKQLTAGSYEDMPSLTPDNKWVIYRTGNNVRKVPLDGGNSVKLLDKSVLYPVVSTDGRLLAFFTNEHPDSHEWQLEVFDLETLNIVKRFVLPETANPFSGLCWTMDGQGLTYVSNAGGAANLWLQPLRGGAPKQLTDFKDAEIISFAWSPALRQMVCVRSAKTYIPVLINLFQ